MSNVYRLALSASLALLAFPVGLFAQSIQPLNTLGQRTEQSLNRADSVRQSATSSLRQVGSHLDSTRQRVDSLGAVRVVDTLAQRYNSVQQRVTSVSATINSPALPNLPALPPNPTLPSLPNTLPSRFPARQALDRVAAFRDQAGQYTQQFSGSVQQGTQALQNAPATLEQQAHQLPDMDLLQQSPAASADTLNSPLGQPNLSADASSNHAKIQEQMIQQARQGVRRHFAQHTEELQTGRQELAKLKRKYKAVQSEQDKYQRATSLKGEPWTARLLLGSYFQFYREPSFQVDLSPFVGYRFNTRWSVGVGGSYRAAFRRIPGSAPVYQGRVFVEGEVYRGFAAHVAYERSGPSSPVLSQGEDRAIVDQHLLVGIGKSYRITRKIRGTTLLLYRPGDIDQSLQLSRWNLRTGFFLGGK